jgi:cardiolipin synthase
MFFSKKAVFFRTLLLLILFNALVSCGLEAQNVRFVMDSGYFPEVKALINSSRKSVQLMMFEATFYDKYPDSPSNQLINALMEAAKRGVKVDVILDVNKNNERNTLRNIATGRKLRKAGVDVTLDSKYVTTHTKLLIIDSRIVVCGSTNWTYSALTKNHEVSAVIDCPESAKKLQDYFQVVKSRGKKY